MEHCRDAGGMGSDHMKLEGIVGQLLSSEPNVLPKPFAGGSVIESVGHSQGSERWRHRDRLGDVSRHGGTSIFKSNMSNSTSKGPLAYATLS